MPGKWSLSLNTWKEELKEIVYHEIGHNLGFDHANSCDGISGGRIRITDKMLQNCTFNEYGDITDLMGSIPRNEETDYEHWRFNTYTRFKYGSFPADNILQLLNSTSGLYNLTNADHKDPGKKNIKLILFQMRKPRTITQRFRGENGKEEFSFDHYFFNYSLELISSSNLQFHSNYKTGIIVRMNDHDSTMMPNIVLGSEGDYFEDADNGFKVTLQSITPEVASIIIDFQSNGIIFDEI
jgi:hypothetical protein